MKAVLMALTLGLMLLLSHTAAQALDLNSINAQRMGVGLAPLTGNAPHDMAMLNYECQSGFGPSCTLMQMLFSSGGSSSGGVQRNAQVQQLQCQKCRRSEADCWRNAQNMSGTNAIMMQSTCRRWATTCAQTCGGY